MITTTNLSVEPGKAHLTAPCAAAAVELRSRDAEHLRQRTAGNSLSPALNLQHTNLLIDRCADEQHRLQSLES
jgi:hypothetical protein